MNKKDRDQLISDPNSFFSRFEKLGVDFSKVELDLGRTMVRKRLNLTNEEINAVEFVYWMSYLIETELKQMILFVEKKLGNSPNMLDAILGKLNFGDKISLIEENYNINGKQDDFIKMCRKINGLRNHVAHGRFKMLVYGGLKLSDAKGQIKLSADIVNAARR